MANTLDDLGMRGLFLVGDESNITGPLARSGRASGRSCPLHLVLPRCRAVVHSASLGTTAAVLDSGIPSLAVPLLFDQIWNAYRTAQIARRARARHPRRERARKLVQQLVTDRALQDNVARALGPACAASAVPSRAADEVEAALGSGQTDASTESETG